MQHVNYTNILALLSCCACKKNTVTLGEFSLCRNSHITCSTCRSSLGRTCSVCKEIYEFDDGKNIANNNAGLNLFRLLLAEIAVPCLFASRGCPAILFPDSRRRHMVEDCGYRPVECVFANRGCKEEPSLKQIVAHQRECQFKR